MLHQVNTGAANYAQTFPAFHRRDGGANALTGIRAAHSAFIKRHDPPDAEPDAGRNPAAGLAAANRLANATNTEASAFLKGAKETLRNGSYTALDVLESTEEGRAILDKLKASDAGLEISHSPDTGRVYVYTGAVEDELAIMRQREWERTYGETAQTAAPAAQHADSVEISDAGRELAAKMSEANAAPASILKFVKANGEEYTAQLRKHDPDNPFFVLDEDIFTKAPTPINQFDSLDPKAFLYGDNELAFTIAANLKFKYDVDNVTAFRLSAELGRLLLDPNGTLEERTVNREKGLELAKYFADNYIDDPDAKQKFLDRAKEVANISEMRDKGYDFRYNMEDGTTTIEKTDDNLLASWGKPTEKAATAIIEQVKKSLDKNAVKEDAINTFKKIMAEYLNEDGTLAAPAAPKVVGHLVM